MENEYEKHGIKMSKEIQAVKKLDLCPSCKSQLNTMRTDKDRIERRCPTCNIIVVDTIKNEDK